VAGLTFQFLDVGQGDGTFITFPNGKTMLVDLGSTKNKAVTAQSAFKYFRDHTKFGTPNQVLDYVVITHADRDHYNLINELCVELKIYVDKLLYGGFLSSYTKSKFLPPMTAPRQAPGVPPLAADASHNILAWLVQNAGAQVMTVRPPYPAPLCTQADTGCDVWMLACNTNAALASVGTKRKLDESGPEKNTCSVVLLFAYGGQQVILTGDATYQTEQGIISSMQQRAGTAGLPALKSDVLKIAHHGSARECNSPAWLAAVNPDYAIISSDRNGNAAVGANTGYRIPQTLVLDRVIQYCPGLTKNVGAHLCYGYFEKVNYTGENAAVTPYAWQPIGGGGAGDAAGYFWTQQTASNWGIFSTLGKLGVTDASADVGVQIECAIGAAGSISIKTTDAEENNTA
jgi:beta-lactamase superfamily II metal-dependent hydrolase